MVGSPPFISHKKALWKGNNPTYGDLLTMVINHLKTRMILQVNNLKQPTSPHGFVPHQPFGFSCVFVGKLIVQKLPSGTLIRFLQAFRRRGCHGGSLTRKVEKMEPIKPWIISITSTLFLEKKHDFFITMKGRNVFFSIFGSNHLKQIQFSNLFHFLFQKKLAAIFYSRLTQNFI